MHTIPHNVGHVKRKENKRKTHFIYMYLKVNRRKQQQKKNENQQQKKRPSNGENFEAYGV